MTVKELVSKLAKLEGKRHQASVGDIRELVGLISDELFKDPSLAELLIKNGKKRPKKK